MDSSSPPVTKVPEPCILSTAEPFHSASDQFLPILDLAKTASVLTYDNRSVIGCCGL
jgi:hypothetical protein